MDVTGQHEVPHDWKGRVFPPRARPLPTRWTDWLTWSFFVFVSTAAAVAAVTVWRLDDLMGVRLVLGMLLLWPCAGILACDRGNRRQVVTFIVVTVAALGLHYGSSELNELLVATTERRGAAIVRALDAFQATRGREARDLEELAQSHRDAVVAPLLVGSRWVYTPGNRFARLRFTWSGSVCLCTNDGQRWFSDARG